MQNNSILNKAKYPENTDNSIQITTRSKRHCEQTCKNVV